MTNLGIAPPDFSTPVGEFRLQIDDIEYSEFDPPVPGYGDYVNCSDAEIEGYLAQGGSVTRALGYYYLSLASKAAILSSSIKDHDLAVSTEKRAEQLKTIADSWFALADREDGTAGETDIFESFSFGGDECSTPELAPCWRNCEC